MEGAQHRSSLALQVSPHPTGAQDVDPDLRVPATPEQQSKQLPRQNLVAITRNPENPTLPPSVPTTRPGALWYMIPPDS